MTISYEENDMEGESAYIKSGTPLADLRSDFGKLINDSIAQAFSNFDNFIEDLIKKSVIPEQRQWLQLLAKTGLSELEIHQSEYIGIDVLFRFNLQNGMSPSISLPPKVIPEETPQSLNDLYSIFGQINHYEYGMAGGISKIEDLCTIEDMGVWFSDENTIDTTKCIAFYNTSFGDTACTMGEDSLVRYNHESGELSKAESVSKFLKSYFRELVEGKQLSL